MPMRDAFFIDHDYDRDYASNRVSRYSAYLANHEDMFRDYGEPGTRTTDPVRFALTAWDIANSPIMAPGYVRTAPRVLGTASEWDDEQHAALIVNLAVPVLPIAAGALKSLWRTWEHDAITGRVHAPYDNTRLTVLTTLSINVPVPPASLPTPRYRHDMPDTITARQAVTQLCALLNAHVNIVLAALN